MPVPAPLDTAGDLTRRVMVTDFLMDDKDAKTGTANATIDGQPYRARFRVKEDGRFEILGKAPQYDLGPAALRVSARGAARGAFSVVPGIPWYLPQWAGEKLVDYGGQLGSAALGPMIPDNPWPPMPGDWPATGFPGHLGEFGRAFSSERQHDNLQRRRIFDQLTGPGGVDEGKAAEILMATYKDTQPGYDRSGGRTGFLDPEHPVRSLDKGTEAILEQLEGLDFDRGALSGLSNREVMALSGLETAWEFLGGLAGFKMGAGAVKAGGNPEVVKVFSDLVSDYRQVAKQQGTGQFWKWKKPEKPAAQPKAAGDDRVPLDQQMADKGRRFFKRSVDVSRETGSKAAKLLGGAGAGAAIFTGAMTTPERDERGNLRTKEDIYDDSRFRGAMAEVIRTAGVAGLHKLGGMVHARIEKGVISNLEEMAAEGNLEAKAYLDDIRGGEIDIIGWLKDHGTQEMIEDFKKADDVATRLGAEFSVMTHLGRIGAHIAETLVKWNPARARKRLRETLEADQKELRRVTDDMNARLAAMRDEHGNIVRDADGKIVTDPHLMGDPPPMTGRTTHETGHARPSAEAEGAAYGELIDSTRKQYRDTMAGFAKEYKELNDQGRAVRINTEGIDIPSVTDNLLVQAESVHSLIEPKLWQTVRNIAARARAARENGVEFVLSATDAHEIIRLNNSVSRALGTRYSEKHMVGEASRLLRQRITRANRGLGNSWANLDRRYNAQVARVYRGGLGVGRRTPEKMVMEGKYDWYRVKNDLFGKSDNRINEVAFFDMEKVGNHEELANAITKTARGSLVDAAGNIDFRKFNDFLEKNKSTLNAGSPTGKMVIDQLVGDVNASLARALGRTEGKVIDADLISGAVSDPGMMRNLMRVVDSGTDGADLKTLRWAVVQKLIGKDAPADDMARHAQSYEELFAGDLEHLQMIRDIAEMKQRLNYFEGLQKAYLSNPKALLVGEDSWRSRIQTAAMASLGTTVQSITANVKMVLGIRTQGHAYGAAHLGSMYLGVTEMQRVLDMMTGAAGTKAGANIVHKLMTPMDPEGARGKVFNRRFINAAYQYLKPYFYEYEQGQYPSTPAEDEANVIDTSLLQAQMRQRGR